MTSQRKRKILFNIFFVIVGLFAFIQMPLLGLFGLGAVLTQGILGPGRNKVGGVIMSKWKSINYIRGYAVPSNPNSDAQQIQRAHFKSMVQFAQKLMVGLIPQMWDPFYDNMSGFNAFVKDNWDDYILSDEPTVNTVFSKGTLEPVFNLAATYGAMAGTTTVSWNADVFGNGLSTDFIFITAVSKLTNLALYQGTPPAVTRATEEAVLDLPDGLTATDILVSITTYRGTGIDYVQSNDVREFATSV